MNASDERGIKIVERDKIKNFASPQCESPRSGWWYPAPPVSSQKFKIIIILDECDSMTKDAQGALAERWRSIPLLRDSA